MFNVNNFNGGSSTYDRGLIVSDFWLAIIVRLKLKIHILGILTDLEIKKIHCVVCDLLSAY